MQAGTFLTETPLKATSGASETSSSVVGSDNAGFINSIMMSLDETKVRRLRREFEFRGSAGLSCAEFVMVMKQALEDKSARHSSSDLTGNLCELFAQIGLYSFLFPICVSILYFLIRASFDYFRREWGRFHGVGRVYVVCGGDGSGDSPAQAGRDQTVQLPGVPKDRGWIVEGPLAALSTPSR